MTEQKCDNIECLNEIEELNARLAEAEDTLRAIRSGEVDALVVSGPQGNQVYTLKGAESTYRVLVEAMNEGALVMTPDGTVMYSNSAFADMLEVPLEQVIGSRIHRFVSDWDLENVDELLREGQQTEAKRELALRNRSKDKIVPAQVSVGSLPEGETEGMAAVVTDLTEHKRTEAELDLYRKNLEELVAKRTEQLQETAEELESSNEELRTTADELAISNRSLIQENTERKQAEKALRESEERYRMLFISLNEGFYFAEIIYDESGRPCDYRYIEANPAFERIMGLSRDHIIGKRYTELVAPDPESGWFEVFTDVALTGTPTNYSFYSNVFHRYFDTVAFKPTENHFAVLVNDVTARKLAEQALKESEDRFRLMADSAPVIIWVANARGETEFVNKTYTEFFGVTYEEAEGSNWWPLVQPDDVPAYIDVYMRSIQEHTPFRAEARVRRADGEWRWIESYADPRFSPNGEFLGHTGISFDITERKIAEEALRESDLKYRKLFESKVNGITYCQIILDEKGQPVDYRFLDANATFENMTGLKRELVLGHTAREIMPGIENAAFDFIGIHGNVALTGKETTFESFQEYLNRWYSVYIYSTKKGYFVSIFTDITERKMAEQALQESEERFRVTIQNSPVTVSTQDADLRYTWIYNPHAGYTSESIIGNTDFERFPPEAAQRVTELKLQAMETRSKARDEVCIQMENETLYYDFIIEPQCDPDGKVTGVTNVVVDITEAKQAEKALAKAKELLEHQVYLLQRALIPAKPPVIEGYPIASAYIPAYEGQEIGGDFLDVFKTEEGKVGILIGDVSGKGLEAAALAVNTRSTVGAFAYDSSLPGDALTHANSVLYAKQADFEHFVTVFLAILDPSTGDISYASAGHTPAIISRANGEMELLYPQSTPLGITDGVNYEQGNSNLQPGDKIVLYTDGISEARSTGTDFFGTEGIERVLAAHGQETTVELVTEILDAVNEWAHGNLRDDTAVLVMSREDTPGHNRVRQQRLFD